MFENPFLLHRQAFTAELTGNFEAARQLFLQAYRAFSMQFKNQGFRLALVERARLIPDAEASPESIADELIEELPGWFAKLHEDRIKRNLLQEQAWMLRTHWQILVELACLPNFSEVVNLNLIRDSFCDQFLRTKLHDCLPQEREDALKLAECLLRIDPHNHTARDYAIEGYAKELERKFDLMEKKLNRRRNSGQASTGLNLPDFDETDVRKLRTSLPRNARCLRRHLNAAVRLKPTGSSFAKKGYTILSRFYAATGDENLSIKMARRNFKLHPEDEELRRFLRELRRFFRRRHSRRPSNASTP